MSDAAARDSFLAIDLGAESGRVVLAVLEGGRLVADEVYRFPNEPVWYGGELHWDLPRLWLEIQRGLETASRRTSGGLTSLGVDTWGLDFAFLSSSGALLENPYHYRDPRTDGMVERVCEIVAPEEIYERTGVQFMQINSLYQLYAAQVKSPEVLRAADRLLTIPDLLNYWLTGRALCEFTNATTTQFFDARSRSWAVDLLERLGIPTHFLGPIVEPGTELGRPVPRIASLCGDRAVVVAPACHDTGSAVAGIPLDQGVCYISSGTWSLLGTEVSRPVITADARRYNFTNEGGVCGTTRVLKNIAGMWLVQCCRRHWKAEGREFDYGELAESARNSAPLESVIDPDHPAFRKDERMPGKIAQFCRATGQREPTTPGAVVRTALESLALKYRLVLENLESTVGRHFEAIRIVGGGAKNELLNQLTADATGRRVLAGPIEATALGNIAMQMLATGRAPDLTAVRAIIDASYPPSVFEPQDTSRWDRAWDRFRECCADPPTLKD